MFTSSSFSPITINVLLDLFWWAKDGSGIWLSPFHKPNID